MIAKTTITALLATLSAAGCVKIEGGFKYEYEGRVLREDGKTPAKNVAAGPRASRSRSQCAPVSRSKTDQSRFERSSAAMTNQPIEVSTNFEPAGACARA